MQTKKIGQRLSFLMKKKGVTQTQVSSNNIMRPSTLQKILSGQTSNNKKIIEDTRISGSYQRREKRNL